MILYYDVFIYYIDFGRNLPNELLGKYNLFPEKSLKTLKLKSINLTEYKILLNFRDFPKKNQQISNLFSALKV